MVKVLFLGPKSPPVTGYANIVNALAKCLIKEGASVKYISTVPCFLAPLFPSALWKLFRLMYLSFVFPAVLVVMPFNAVLYVNINGDLGQFFDVFFVAIGRILGKNIILHHNSYGYINNKKILSQWLFFIAGSNAKHVVNCDDMSQKLVSTYDYVKNVYIVSNSSILIMENSNYFASNDFVAKRSDYDENILTLGFMGYFNLEKGIDTFSSIVKGIEGIENHAVRGVAVGPVYDEKLIKMLKQQYGNLIEFRPPVFGQQRDNFFNEIDILFFPSRYLNEAEPLTVHHALSMGVPIVATDVGCLKQILGQFDSCYSLSADDYLLGAEKVVRDELLSKSFEQRKALKTSLKDNYRRCSLDSIADFKITLAKLGLI